MRIAIVDDMETDRAHMAELASQCCDKLGLPCDILHFTSGDAFLRKFEPGRFTAVLLDIFMDGMDGMETSKKLREVDRELKIVFVTVTDQYAVQGYEVGAAHYLMKPATSEGMERALRFCLTRKALDERFIMVKEGHREYSLLMCNILYVHAGRNHVVLYTTRGQAKMYTSYVRFAPQLLGDARFLACGHGTIVNLDHVSGMGKKGFVMDGGEIIQIAARDKEHLRQAWMSYEARQQEEKWG